MDDAGSIVAIERIHRAAMAYAKKMGCSDISEDIAQEVVISFLRGKRKTFYIRTAVVDAVRVILGDSRTKAGRDRAEATHVPLEEAASLQVAFSYPQTVLMLLREKRLRDFFWLHHICGYAWSELILSQEYSFGECVSMTREIKLAALEAMS